MLDFQNGKYVKLRKVKDTPSDIEKLLIHDEQVIGTYKSIRDYVVFTTKRVIAVNVQGMTGTKKDFTILPYSKVQTYSIETSGILDIDSELTMYFSSLGQVSFEFTGGSDIILISKILAQYVL